MEIKRSNCKRYTKYYDETDGEIKIERDNDSHPRRLLHPHDFEAKSSISF
jgi:hypothetical protein